MAESIIPKFCFAFAFACGIVCLVVPFCFGQNPPAEFKIDPAQSQQGSPVGNPDDPFGESGPFEETEASIAAAGGDGKSTVEMLLRLQKLTQTIIAEATPAVVAIDETGSGVIVSQDGLVLTASHVTRVANRQVTVVMSDGRMVQGITLGSNIASDTGAIRLVNPGPYPFASVKNSKEARSGSWCIAMGYPLSFPRGKPATGRLGRVTKRNKNGKLITDCTIMGGDSGGPLLDLTGKVIGISSSVKLDVGQNLFVPSEQFIKDWEGIALSIDKTSLETTGKVPAEIAPQAKKNGFTVTQPPTGKAYLGINAETDDNLVRVRAVHRESPAEFAGIQANDVIVEMDGDSLRSFAELVQRLKSKKPGQKIQVVLNRYGSLAKTTVTLGGTRAK